MQEWRKARPGYSAVQKRRQELRKTLRRVLSPDLAAAIKSCALQDLNDRQLALMLGILGRLSGVALQDQMAGLLRRLMFDGYALLRKPEPK